MYNQTENEIDLADLFRLLLSKIWLLIIVTIIGGAAGFCLSKFVLPLKYASHISMYVQSYYGISESSANINNNISNSKQLVNTYIEVLKDDAVMNAVGEELQKQFDEGTLSACYKFNEAGKIAPSSIRSSMSISSVTDTSALTVTVTTLNAEVAAAVCNDLTRVAPEYVQKAVGVGSINTIDTAKVYDTPVSPNNKKNAAIGAFGAFALAVLIIFLIDFFDNTVKDADTVGKTYQKAIIGEIQQFESEKSRKKKKSTDTDDHMRLTDKNVPFYIVESYKSIRTNIMFSLSTVEKKIFAVSSANPGEGKSTTSANIAIAMAQGGNRVLLIDADMRKAVQHKIFGLKNKKGLSYAISKMSRLDDCIQKNVMENLDVMTAGPIPPNPSELLASENMTAMMEKLIQEYSVIIIDTPPINVVTDAMELAKNISGIIMVLRYAKTTTEDVDDAVKKLDFAQMNTLGFILNDIKSAHHGRYYSKYKYKDKYYYKKGYGYGYGYGYYGRKPDSDSSDDNNGENNAESKDSKKQDTKKQEGK
jgi:capsular exopolysaccharide synthesis family protein